MLVVAAGRVGHTEGSTLSHAADVATFVVAGLASLTMIDFLDGGASIAVAWYSENVFVTIVVDRATLPFVL